MTALEEILHLVKLGIYSPFISREKGVSIMIIAPPEHGKTELVKRFAFVESVLYTTDFNTFIFADYAMQYPKKRTIIIPDFLKVTKKKYSTASVSLTTINAITEEGWLGKLPLGQLVDKPIFGNVITALTSDELKDKRHKWMKIGFLSRFIPVTFSYNDDTKKAIRQYIKDRIYTKEEDEHLNLPQYMTDITMPKEIADKLEKICLDISQRNNILGFRLQKQIQTLAMANALLSHRAMVDDTDVELMQKLSRFINYKFTKV